jgi:hypothetical protein
MHGLRFPEPAPPPPWLARLIRRTGLAILFAVAGVGAYFAGVVAADGLAVRQVPRPTANGLSVDPAALDLGEVWEHPRHVVRLTVRNDATTPRVVEKFAGSCGCTTIEPLSLTLPPGGSADLTVTIDLTQRPSHHLGLARRPLAVQVQPVFAGDFRASDGWTLTGAVRHYASAETTRLGFLDGCVHRGPARSRKVLIAAHQRLDRVEAEADPASAAVRVEPAGTDRYAVVVTPNPRMPSGPFRFPVAVRAVTPDGLAHPVGSIEVRGEMHPPVRVSPRTALVGEVGVPGPAVAEVAVALPDGWAVARVESDAAGTDVRPAGAAPDGGVLYRIAQPLAAAGDFNTRVRFVVRGPDGRTESAAVDVRGLGRAPVPTGGRP